MKRFGFVVAAMSLCMLLASGAEAGLRKVSVSAGSGGMDGAICVAMAKGYFAEQGIEIDYQIYRNGSIAQKAFVDGKVDFGTSNRVSIVLGGLDEKTCAVIGVLAYTDSQTKVLCRKDSGIFEPADLKGKRIATVEATTAHYYLYKYLINSGIAPEDVEIVYVSKKELPGIIASGDVDAICQHGTPIEKAKSLLGDNAVQFMNPNLDRKAVPLVARRKMIAEEPELIEGMFRALKKAEGWIPSHQEEASRIIADMKNRSYEGTLKFVRDEVEFDLSLKQGLLLNLESVDRWAIESGLVDYKKPRNFFELIDYAPLEKVFPGSVTIIR